MAEERPLVALEKRGEIEVLVKRSHAVGHVGRAAALEEQVPITQDSKRERKRNFVEDGDVDIVPAQEPGQAVDQMQAKFEAIAGGCLLVQEDGEVDVAVRPGLPAGIRAKDEAKGHFWHGLQVGMKSRVDLLPGRRRA